MADEEKFDFDKLFDDPRWNEYSDSSERATLPKAKPAFDQLNAEVQQFTEDYRYGRLFITNEIEGVKNKGDSALLLEELAKKHKLGFVEDGIQHGEIFDPRLFVVGVVHAFDGDEIASQIINVRHERLEKFYKELITGLTDLRKEQGIDTVPGLFIKRGEGKYELSHQGQIYLTMVKNGKKDIAALSPQKDGITPAVLDELKALDVHTYFNSDFDILEKMVELWDRQTEDYKNLKECVTQPRIELEKCIRHDDDYSFEKAKFVIDMGKDAVQSTYLWSIPLKTFREKAEDHKIDYVSLVPL